MVWVVGSSAVVGMLVEFVSERKICDRNKIYYCVSYWLIWVWVFFIVLGFFIFDLFDVGFDLWMVVWFGVVFIGIGVVGLRGRLFGVELRSYII